VHVIEPKSYHITLFMPSKPGDLRPDPFLSDGGVNLGYSGLTAETLASELAVCQKLAAQMPVPTLEVCALDPVSFSPF
jgi:hypothetical protein